MVFNLTPVSALPVTPGKPLRGFMTLRETDPSRYALFRNEWDRYVAEAAIVQSKIDKTKQLDSAFKRMQDAENVRDKAPQAYEQARVGYYSMLEGPKWIEGEKQRIAKVEVDPIVTQYRQSYDTIKSRQQNQQRTQDIMNSVKEGVLTLKDDFKYTTGIFKEQIENLKNQINIERRGRETPETDATEFYKWIDALLNLFIIGGLLYAAFVFWRKLGSRREQPAYAPVAIVG